MIRRLITLMLLTLLASGCQFLPEAAPEELATPDSAPVEVDLAVAEAEREAQRLREQSKLVGVPSTVNAFDPVSEAVHQMAEQLSVGLKKHKVKRLPMMIMPFVDLERASQRYTGALGERVSDSFFFQLQQYDFNLIDYRAVSLATTAKNLVSRQNMSSLRNRYRIYFILTGTYSRYPDGIVINARVLDTTSRQVLATAQSHIPDERLEGKWPGYNALEAIEKGLIIENQQGPLNP
ncbi:MAG: FlgO family outer membrane protein [Pontibacterium sp.]